MAAHRDLVMLHRIPDRLNIRQLRTVRRKIKQENVGPFECGDRVPNRLTGMNRVAVQNQMQRTLTLPVLRRAFGTTRNPPEESQETLTSNRADFGCR